MINSHYLKENSFCAFLMEDYSRIYIGTVIEFDEEVIYLKNSCLLLGAKKVSKNYLRERFDSTRERVYFSPLVDEVRRVVRLKR